MSRDLHHANLLIGTPEQAESYFSVLCKSLDITVANNPDLVTFRIDTFGIDEARELRLLSTRKALSDKKFFFIIPIRLTLEAQNALLKTFEDPSPETYFFLTTREESLIVPTLRSRMKIIPVGHGGDASVSADAEKFLAFPIKKRLMFAKSFVDDEKNLPIFLDSLLYLLKRQGMEEKQLRSVYNIRRHIHDSSIASRLVLEHLSLVLP